MDSQMRMLTMLKNGIVETKNSDYYFGIFGVILIVISLIINLVVQPNLNAIIMQKNQDLLDFDHDINLLHTDFYEQQTWETQSLLLRNVINTLEAINNTLFKNSIQDRRKELLELQINGLEALTRHLFLNDTIKQKWKSMSFNQLKEEKRTYNELLNDFLKAGNVLRNRTQTELYQHINQLSINNNTFVILNVSGFIIFNIGTFIHWKKHDLNK